MQSQRRSAPMFFGWPGWTGPATFNSKQKFADGVSTPLRLESLHLHHSLHLDFPLQSLTTATMTFFNEESAVLEGDLQFCLPPGSNVVAFALDVDGQLVDGVVVEKEKARIAFESEVRKGVDPGLVELVSGNTFKTRVYPMPPRGRRTVRVSYQATASTNEQGDVASSFPVLFQHTLKELSIEVSILGQQKDGGEGQGPQDLKPVFSSYLPGTPLPSFQSGKEGSSAAYSFSHFYFDVVPDPMTGLGTGCIEVVLPRVGEQAVLMALEKDTEDPTLTYFAISYKPPVPALPENKVAVAGGVGLVAPVRKLCVLWDASLSRLVDEVPGHRGAPQAPGGLKARLAEIAALKNMVLYYVTKMQVRVELTLVMFRHVPDQPWSISFEPGHQEGVQLAWAQVESMLNNVAYDGATDLQGLKAAMLAAGGEGEEREAGEQPGDHASFDYFYLFSDGLSSLSTSSGGDEALGADANVLPPSVLQSLFATFPAPVVCFNANPVSLPSNTLLLSYLAESSGAGLGAVFDEVAIRERILQGSMEQLEQVMKQLEGAQWLFQAYSTRPAPKRVGEDVDMEEAPQPAQPFARASAPPLIEPEQQEGVPAAPGGVPAAVPVGLPAVVPAAAAGPPAALPPKQREGLSDIFPFSSTSLSNGRLLVVGKLRGSTPYELELRFGPRGLPDGVSPDLYTHTRFFVLDPSHALTPFASAGGSILRRLLGSRKLSVLQVYPELNLDQIRAVGLKYGLVSEGTSIMVLETLQQHLEHKIVPAKSRVKLYEQYVQAMQDKYRAKEKERRSQLTVVEGYWRERCRWYDKAMTPIPKQPIFGPGSSLTFGQQPICPGVAMRRMADMAPEEDQPDEEQEWEESESAYRPPPCGMAPDGGPVSGAPPPPPSLSFSAAPPPPQQSFARAERSMQKRSDAVNRSFGGFGSAAPAPSGAPAPSASRSRLSESSSSSPSSGPSSSGPSILVKAYDSAQPYMAKLKAASSLEAAYAIYLEQRKKYRMSPSYYFDCASFFLSPPTHLIKQEQSDQAGAASPSSSFSAASHQKVKKPGFIKRFLGISAPEHASLPAISSDSSSSYKHSKRTGPRVNSFGRSLGIRILTNIVEQQLSEVQLLRVIAYKLQEYGEYTLAIQVFRTVRALRPDEPQSFRDLGLCLEEAGHYEAAMHCLNQVLVGKWDTRFSEIEVTACHELNVLIGNEAGGRKKRYEQLKERGFLLPGIDGAQHLQPGAALVAAPLSIPPLPSLQRFMPCDLRIVMVWDTNDTDVDLHVVEPSGEECYYGNRTTRSGGMLSRDFRQGYGPEEYLIAKAPLGVYKVSAKFFANHQQSLVGATTLMLHVFKYWGSAHQEKEVITLRLDQNKERMPVAEIKFEPPKKVDTIESLKEELATSQNAVKQLKEENKQLQKQVAQLSRPQVKPVPQPLLPAPLPPNSAVVHDGVSCDVCSAAPLVGARYKCLVCVNYDSCQSCELNRRLPAGPTPHSLSHPMMRLEDSRPWQNSPLVWNKEQYVHQVACSGCHALPIIGFRYRCQCGQELCEACEIAGKHDLSHVRTKILQPMR